MAFDPAEFLAESTEPKKEAAPAAAPAEQPRATESKFNPAEFLAQTETPTSTIPEPQGSVAPQFAVPGPTGINPGAIKEAISPFMEVGKGVIQGYKNNPVGGLADAVLMHGGMPPVFGGAKGFETARDLYHAAKETAANVSKGASQGELVPGQTPGVMYPETVPGFRAMQRASPELANKLTDIFHNGGGNNGVKEFLASPEGQAALKANPGAAAAAEEYLAKVPGAFTQIGRVLGPVARGIGKVAGPAGLALNAYDAAQYAQDAELGKRLAQGQGQQAQHAYRQLPSQINTPNNPQPGTPQFAALQQQYAPAKAVVQPQASQQTNINDAIRIAAAKKALGQ
jgi:hypothetical protein